MSKPARFTKMLGFELRAVIYGNPLDHNNPFVDLRRNEGVYTVNAIFGQYEYEYEIGKRWFRRDIPKYIMFSLQKLLEMINRCNTDKTYAYTIRLEQPFEM